MGLGTKGRRGGRRMKKCPVIFNPTNYMGEAGKKILGGGRGSGGKRGKKIYRCEEREVRFGSEGASLIRART